MLIISYHIYLKLYVNNNCIDIYPIFNDVRFIKLFYLCLNVLSRLP